MHITEFSHNRAYTLNSIGDIYMEKLLCCHLTFVVTLCYDTHMKN